MIKAIIFDIGSTILTRNWKKQRKNIYDKFGIYPDWGQEAQEIKKLAVIGKASLREVFKASIKETKSNISLENFIEFYKKSYLDSSPIKKSMINLIKKIKKNYKLYAFSNTYDLHAEINEKRKIWELFDKAFLSIDIHLKKPEKASYLHVLNNIKLRPDETIFIDDKEENIEMANKLGINAIKYTSCSKLIKDLKNLGVRL